MGKAIIVILLALGVGLYFPNSREKIVNTVKPIGYPFLGWITDGEMDRISQDLVTYEQMYRKFPGIRGFDDWMNERYNDDQLTRDSWGTRYQLRTGGRGVFVVVSAGPDTEFGTDDDRTKEGTRPDLNR